MAATSSAGRLESEVPAAGGVGSGAGVEGVSGLAVAGVAAAGIAGAAKGGATTMGGSVTMGGSGVRMVAMTTADTAYESASTSTAIGAERKRTSEPAATEGGSELEKR
mgnify:CR=1 FL=1